MFNTYVLFAFLISFGLSIWVISVYEFNKMGLPFDYIKGWDTFAKTIAYSIIGGWIIFLLTYTLPYTLQKRRIQKIIQEDLADLNIEVSDLLSKFCNRNHLKPQYAEINIQNKNKLIIKNSSFIYVLKQINWDDWYDSEKMITNRELFLSVLRKIVWHITNLQVLYKDYLTTEQIRCFNTICRVSLDKNWAIDIFGDVSQRVDMMNLVIQICKPLQKSMGIDLPKSMNEIHDNYISK